MKLKIRNSKFTNAFSFVEVMVAVFLVSVGLLASLKLLTQGLRETMDSRDQLIASFLAQEGTELVRSVRDNNWASGNSSFSGINIADGQKIDNLDITLTTSGSSTLTLNSNNYYIHSTTGTKTKYARKIDVSGDENQRVILSMVVWNGKSSNQFSGLTKSNCNADNKCAYAEDVLTNWGE